MIFNFWRKYPRRKPKVSGRYLCTLDSGEVLDLYFTMIDGGGWLDNRRQNVFDGYKVYKSGREALDHNRVYSDVLCERESVIAWKKMPKGYSRK